MAGRRTVRLNRDMIIAAALRVSESSRGGGQVPTGRVLGEELGVDRSAIWRHFRDADELLLATNDALLARVVEEVEADADPEDVLRALWKGMVGIALAHPQIAVELGGRYNAGPHVVAAIELTLGALTRMGFAPAEAVGEYRAFIDMALAYASMVAHYSLLDPATVREQEAQVLRSAAALEGAEHEMIRTVADRLVGLDPTVTDTIVETYLLGLRTKLRRERPLTVEDPGPGTSA